MSDPTQADNQADPNSSPPVASSPEVRASLARYWRSNVTIMSILLAIWAFVSLGCGILFADYLNHFQLGGVPLGFWFAQQGSIITFVLLILIYALFMNALDKKHLRELEALKQQQSQAGEA